METKTDGKTPVRFTPLRIAALAALAALLAVSGLLYWKYSRLKSLADLKLSEQIEKKIGRKVVVGGMAFSPLEGLKLEKTCVKEKDGKKDFFCFEKASIKVETLPALKGRIIFSDVSFENGVLNLKRTEGVWNFSDLIDLLPKNNKPIHLNWNARNFAFSGFSINASLDKEGRNEILLDEAMISVKHRSNTGGNFALEIKSGINANLGGNFISGQLHSASDLNFEYSRLRSFSGTLKVGKIVFGDITARGIEAELEAFGLDGKNSEKKFDLKAALSDLLIPAGNPLAGRISEKAAVLEKILGKTVQSENEFFTKELEIKSAYDGSIFSNSVALDSNLLELYVKSSMDITNSRHSVSLEMKNRAKTVKIRSESAIGRPKTEPAMSETMDGMLKLGIVSLEKYLLKKIGD